MFRGYPIERLIDAGYGPVAAGGLTWALFTVAHVVRDTRPETCFRSRSRPSSSPWSTSASARSFPSSLGHVVIDLVGVLAYVFS